MYVRSCNTFLLTYMYAGKDDQILALGSKSFATFLSLEMQFCSFTDVIFSLLLLLMRMMMQSNTHTTEEQQ